MDGWRTEYVRTNWDTETCLGVNANSGGKWGWYMEGLRSNEGLITDHGSMFDTPEESAENALKYYNEEWLPCYKETGSREGPEE